jgi:hypothetical protein
MNDLTLETEIATRHGIPLGRLRDWRKDNTLIEGTHWQRQPSKAIAITPAGYTAILAQVQLDPDSALEGDPEDTPTQTTATIPLKVARNQGLNPRLLRCLLIDPIEGIGPRVAVRLITPRVATRHFKPGTTIDATPTDTPDIFEYHGPKPRTLRI